MQTMATLRIVSLLPSATEIVCALGAENDLVGISHECDFPDAIRDRPVLTRSRIDVHGTSRAIDTAVREVITDALTLLRHVRGGRVPARRGAWQAGQRGSQRAMARAIASRMVAKLSAK